ncbi:MAG: hypothetical protein ABFS46_12425 [Myxococcota bacterium]
MKRGRASPILPLLILPWLAGCAPSVRVVDLGCDPHRVHESDGELACAEGASLGWFGSWRRRGAIPYFVPRPHLLITRNVQPASEKPSKAATSDVFSYRVIQLPDRARKMGIQLRTGLGSLDSSIVLEEGWRFTGLQSKADAKLAESLEASSQALGALLPALALPVPSEGRSFLWLYDLTTFECVFAWPGDCEDS